MASRKLYSRRAYVGNFLPHYCSTFTLNEAVAVPKFDLDVRDFMPGEFYSICVYLADLKPFFSAYIKSIEHAIMKGCKKNERTRTL